MQINVTYDASVNNAGSQFIANVQSAVQFFESEFSSPVSINIDVGFGEVDGTSFTPSQAAGESRWASSVSANYATVKNILTAQGAPGAATLPSVSPLSGNLLLSPAQAKALGLVATNNNIDGFVGFSSATPAVYTVEHEISEVMGRISQIAGQPSRYSLMDLYRWSAPGVRDLSAGGPGSTAYFSIDNGATNLGSWNNDQTNGFDLGDWYGNNVPNNGEDAFATTSGRVNPIVSQTDITLMESLGWITGWTVSSVSAATDNRSTTVSAGNVVTITMTVSQPVTVTGSPTLQLNDNELANYAGGSGSNVLTFTYSVQTRDSTADLKVTGLNLVAGASINNASGNGLSGSVTADLGIQVLNPTAVMIMDQPSTGDYEIYDIGNNSVLAAYPLTQASSPWQAVDVGAFNGTDTSDLLLRNGSTGAFELFDVSGNTATGPVALGAVGTDWAVLGFGDFSGNPGETDMLMRQSGTAKLEVYDISNNQITNAASMGAVGPEWSFLGVGDFSSNANETDLLMRDSNNGALEVYNVSHNAIVGATGMGAIGVEWNFVGVGDFSGNAGETDMLMRDTNNGALEVYNVHNDQIVSAQAMGAVGLEWSAVGIGDFSGNPGETDVITRNANTGAFEIYDISHDSIVSASSIGAVGTDWQAVGIAPYQSAAAASAASGNSPIDAVVTGAAPLSAGQFGGAAPAEVPAATWAGNDTMSALTGILFQHA